MSFEPSGSISKKIYFFIQLISRQQFVAFVSFYLTVQSINIIFNRYYQKLMVRFIN